MGLVTSSLLSLCVNPGAETRADTHTITRTSAANRSKVKLYNHGEGPYQGLLLVESTYYRFHI